MFIEMIRLNFLSSPKTPDVTALAATKNEDDVWTNKIQAFFLNLNLDLFPGSFEQEF